MAESSRLSWFVKPCFPTHLQSKRGGPRAPTPGRFEGAKGRSPHPRSQPRYQPYPTDPRYPPLPPYGYPPPPRDYHDPYFIPPAYPEDYRMERYPPRDIYRAPDPYYPPEVPRIDYRADPYRTDYRGGDPYAPPTRDRERDSRSDRYVPAESRSEKSRGRRSPPPASSSRDYKQPEADRYSSSYRY